MPAINLIQLRTQLNDLLWNFTDPAAFRKSLLELLEKYAYTAYQPGTDTLSDLNKPDIHIPLIILRELDLALLPVIGEQPQAALAICDQLWDDPNPGIRMIASRILGQIPATHADTVLERAGEWAMHGLDRMTIHNLLENASRTIMRSDPELLLRKVRSWYVDSTREKNNLCLEAMAILAEDRTFENLPALFTLMEALLSDASADTQQNLIDLFQALIRRSPLETVYIIRQRLQGSPNPVELRIIRKILPDLPAETQPSIRDLLRQASRASASDGQ